MLHASKTWKTWPLTKPNLECLQRIDRAMIRQICNVKPQDIVTTRFALSCWTSFWRRRGSAAMDMWNAPMVQSRQPLTYRWMESIGLRGPRRHRSRWQRGIAESGSSWLLTLMIDIPGDLVRDIPCMQQVSYLEGVPLMWMLPLCLHVNQKSYDHCKDVQSQCPPQHCFSDIFTRTIQILLEQCIIIRSSDFWLMCRYRGNIHIPFQVAG